MIKFLYFFLLVVVFLILALQNPLTLRLKFLLWETPPLSILVVILASVLAGLLGGFMMGWRVGGTSSKNSARQSTSPENRPPEKDEAAPAGDETEGP